MKSLFSPPTPLKYPPTETTEKLDGFLLEKESLKARSLQSLQNRVRLNQSINPDFLAVTVRRVDDDIWRDNQKRPGVIVTGDDPAIAKRIPDAIAKTRSGEVVAPMNIRDELDRESRQGALLEDAILEVDRDIYTERQAIALQYRKKVQPLADALLKKFAETLPPMYQALTELHDLRRYMLDNELGLPVVFLVPEFTGHPADKSSPLANYIHEAAKHGFIKVPSELVL